MTHRLSSFSSTARSVRITGILAALASRSTVPQPDSTTGEKAITSTFCAMKERIALIWFSCFCCASENFSSMPASLADDLIDSVLAVRHSLSAPIWAKPSTILPCAKQRQRQAGSGQRGDDGSSLLVHSVSPQTLWWK